MRQSQRETYNKVTAFIYTHTQNKIFIFNADKF